MSQPPQPPQPPQLPQPFQLLRHDVHIELQGRRAQGFIDLFLAGPQGTHQMSLALRWPDGTSTLMPDDTITLSGRPAHATPFHLKLAFLTRAPGLYALEVAVAGHDLGGLPFTVDG